MKDDPSENTRLAEAEALLQTLARKTEVSHTSTAAHGHMRDLAHVSNVQKIQ